MSTSGLSDERIMTVWDWCSEAYIRSGFKLQFPAKTDPTKTYQWRYARAIANKFNEWDFDDPTAKQFITIAIAHTKEAGVLRKGLAALHQSNLLEICYKKLQSMSDDTCQSIDSMRLIRDWLDKRSNGDLVGTMLHRNDVDELCNLVKWVNASRISPLYLSLSRSCGRALARLAKSNLEERELLPKTTKLYILRSEFTEDAENVKQAINIFGADWRKSCQ
jgi:hypothetical protein